MLAVALAAAATLLPPSETTLRYSVRMTARGVTGVELLAEKMRVEAVELREAKKPADALPLFNAAVLLCPTDDARIGRALTFAHLGRHDEQADEYARVLARNPFACDAWQAVAEGWIARGKWAEAATCFARAAELTAPGVFVCEAHLRAALLWLGKGAAIADQASLDPHELARLPIERLIQAEHALTDALREDTHAYRYSRPDVQLLRGVTRHALGRAADATRDYDDCLAVNPTAGPVYLLKAKLAFAANEHDRALAHAEAWDKLGGDPALVAQIRCKSLTGMGEYERAEKSSAEWVKAAPSDPDAAFTRAVTLRLCRTDDEADRASTRAAELHKRSRAEEVYAEVYALWAWYSRHDDADRLLTRNLAEVLTVAERAGFYAQRGDLRRQLRSSEDGFHDLTAAVRLFPAYADARKLRAELALHLRRDSDALEDAEVLTRLTPHDPAAHQLLAQARGAVQLSAAVAGREPDYRPAAPLRAITRDHRYGVALVAAYLPNR